MIGELSTTSTLNPPERKATVLITVSTPGTDSPICRLSNSEDVIRDLTVKQLIQRVISPNSLFSVGVPMSQLQAESAAALAIGEILAADCCEVVTPAKGAACEQNVSLDQFVRAIAREQVGTQGNRFLNVNLEVRSAPDAAAPAGDERRQMTLPPAAEIELRRPVVTSNVLESSSRPTSAWPGPTAPAAPAPAETARPVEGPAIRTAGGPVAPLTPLAVEVPEVASAQEAAEPAAPATGRAPASGIVTIVAEKPTDVPKEDAKERKEYVRKADWLRAQFLPEVEALDFSGLFVGNLGLGVRQENVRRNVVLADPARITEVLLRANGYRRTGDHAKALICYQELVDMDGSNADFRFLLGKTLLALGQREQAAEAFVRAKELGHDGAEREVEELKRAGHRPRATLGFLRFWKQ